jgi:sodium transport system permease protein
MNERPAMNEPPSPSAHLGPQHSSFGRVFRLAHKELREILRDRRTIVTLVAMPLMLYPLMSIVFQQLYLANRVTTGAGPIYRIGALTTHEFKLFDRRFDQGRRHWQTSQAQKTHDAELVLDRSIPNLVRAGPEGLIEYRYQQRTDDLESLKELLREGKLDLIIVIPGLNALEAEKDVPDKDQTSRCQIHYSIDHTFSRQALADVETMFAYFNEAELKVRLGLPGVTKRVHLLNIERVKIETAGGAGVISLAALVPLILILMTITGAVYPAIDLTAGERERGTLEILVAAPVSRFELLTAKYISVLSVAVLTALVNLSCMMATVSWSGLGAALFRDQGFSVAILLQVLALLLLFAAFFSALLLCLTSFARSFKEAQAYLIPLMLVSLAPGVMAMLPGLKLEGVLRVLPLVNIVLLARDLFEGEVDPWVASIVILTTLLYALAALSLAARVFGAESVLYSEQSSWADLVRRPETPQPVATIPAALWCLALMVPIQFSLLAAMRSFHAIAPTTLILLGVPINVLLFGFVPALFMYLGRIDIVSGLRLTRPHPYAMVAALLLGASVWPLELWLMANSGVGANLEERYGKILQPYRDAQQSLGWLVLIVVVAPAILEELFFRGLLFGALKKRSGPLVTIGVSGLLFGATHVVLGGALGLERLAPSTLLGLLLGAVAWRTGSVWPSILLHACHNAILLYVGIQDPGSTQEIPMTWLALGTLGACIGGLLVWATHPEDSKRNRATD